MTAIVDDPEHTLIALDFDGTIAPIVTDPEHAVADPAAVTALSRLGQRVRKVAVITGRPARTAVRLGGFAHRTGLSTMVVLGAYGAERWDAADNTFGGQPDPPAIGAVEPELRTKLSELRLTATRVEHKGRAIGIHTRELDDPAAAFATLLPVLRDLAARHGLHLEPGKFVLELRAPGSDKGGALRALIAETQARQVVFIGDDLGDLPAFEAVRDLREQGLPGLLVCSASAEEDALTEHADVVAPGTDGVAAWLTSLADQLDAR